MHLQSQNDLLEDPIKIVHPSNLTQDIAQTEDDSYTWSKRGSIYTLCSSPQIVNLEAVASMAPSAASICTLVVNAEAWAFGNSDVEFTIDSTVEDDDFTDDNPLAIEVRPERQEQQEKEPLYRDLYRIYRECCESDWDSEGSEPINEQTFLEALTLLDQLPPDLPLPEIMPEPAGNVAFEWYKGKKNIYVISVGGKNHIEYAGLFGAHSKTYGAEYFSGELPELILSHIIRLFS